MKRSRLAVVAAAVSLGLGLVHTACFVVLDFDYDTSSSRDGAVTAPGEAGVARGFALRADPLALTTRQGGVARLHVFIDRDPGFTTPVAVGIAAPPAGVTVSSITFDGALADAFLDVEVGSATPGSADLDIVGSAGADNVGHLHVALDITGAGGGLDPTFGDAGLVVLTPLGLSGSCEHVAILPDGKILCAGYTEVDGGQQGFVVRFDDTGAIDRSFADGGKTITAGPPSDIEPIADGGLLVLTQNANGSATVQCLRANGSVDTTYAAAGSFAVNDSCSVLAASGSRELVGCSHNPLFLGLATLRVTRLTGDGGLDRTWADGGNVDDTAVVGPPSDIAVTSTAEVLVAVSHTKDDLGHNGQVPASPFTLLRFSPNGKLDPSFGDGGASNSGFPTSTGYGVIHRILPEAASDGFFLAGETADEGVNPHPAPSLRMVVARIDGAGHPDPSFGSGGFAKLGALPVSWANDGVMLADGSIVLAGARVDPRGQDVALVHVGANGIVDPTFWTPSLAPITGVATTIGGAAEARAIAVQSDGRLVVAGNARDSADGGAGAMRMFVGRFLP